MAAGKNLVSPAEGIAPKRQQKEQSRTRHRSEGASLKEAWRLRVTHRFRSVNSPPCYNLCVSPGQYLGPFCSHWWACSEWQTMWTDTHFQLNLNTTLCLLFQLSCCKRGSSLWPNYCHISHGWLLFEMPPCVVLTCCLVSLSMRMLGGPPRENICAVSFVHTGRSAAGWVQHEWTNNTVPPGKEEKFTALYIHDGVPESALINVWWSDGKGLNLHIPEMLSNKKTKITQHSRQHCCEAESLVHQGQENVEPYLASAGWWLTRWHGGSCTMCGLQQDFKILAQR